MNFDHPHTRHMEHAHDLARAAMDRLIADGRANDRSLDPLSDESWERSMGKAAQQGYVCQMAPDLRVRFACNTSRTGVVQ